MSFWDEVRKDPNGPQSIFILVLALLIFIVPWAVAKLVFIVALGVILGGLSLRSMLNNKNNKDK